MRRVALLMALASTLLGACSIPGRINEEVLELTNKRSRSPYNTGTAAIGLIMATPPVNTILFNSCDHEIAMDASKRKLCNLNHQIRGNTPPWERIAAEARLMSYQPGEVECQRTLGGKAECRVISGAPRPVNLIAPPSMGAN